MTKSSAVALTQGQEQGLEYQEQEEQKWEQQSQEHGEGGQGQEGQGQVCIEQSILYISFKISIIF